MCVCASLQSPHRTLQRTFSDESLCSGRRDSSYASMPLFEGQVPPSDLLFTCTLPTRRHGHNIIHGALIPSKKGRCNLLVIVSCYVFTLSLLIALG